METQEWEGPKLCTQDQNIKKNSKMLLGQILWYTLGDIFLQRALPTGCKPCEDRYALQVVCNCELFDWWEHRIWRGQSWAHLGKKSAKTDVNSNTLIRPGGTFISSNALSVVENEYEQQQTTRQCNFYRLQSNVKLSKRPTNHVLYPNKVNFP